MSWTLLEIDRSLGLWEDILVVCQLSSVEELASCDDIFSLLDAGELNVSGW